MRLCEIVLLAWLELHPTSGHFKICFRWGGKKKRKSLPVTDPKAAQAILLRFEENVALLERGRLELPATGDIMTFLLSGWQARILTQAHRQCSQNAPRNRGPLPGCSRQRIGRSEFPRNVSHASQPRSSKIRRRVLGQDLVAADLQDYLDTRIRRKGKKSVPLSSVTLRKELASFRACFNWAVQTGLLTGSFSNRGLRFPKGEDKRPFLTWEEIDRRVGRGGLSADETKPLWDCLFLDLPQIDEFLAYVKPRSSRPWMYPMCVVAAHRAARRSELVRMNMDDIDFEQKDDLDPRTKTSQRATAIGDAITCRSWNDSRSSGIGGLAGAPAGRRIAAIGRPYRSITSTTSLMPQAEYERRLLERSHALRRWENQFAARYRPTDLDLDEIRWTLSDAREAGRLVVPTTDPLDAMEKLKVIDNGQVLQAAVVAFAKEMLAGVSARLSRALPGFGARPRMSSWIKGKSPATAFFLLREAELFLRRHLPVRGQLRTG